MQHFTLCFMRFLLFFPHLKQHDTTFEVDNNKGAGLRIILVATERALHPRLFLSDSDNIFLPFL